MKPFQALATVAGAVSFLSPALIAGNAFSVVVSSTDHMAPADVTIGSSSFLDLIDDVINAQAAFQDFEGFFYDASLVYLGVPQAILFSVNPSGTEARLEIPSLNFEQFFMGGNRAEVEQQVEDWFESDGSAVYSEFLASIAQDSPAAVTDGNPNAATAAQAQSTFESLGWTPVEEIVTEDGSSAPSYSGFGIGFNSGRFEAGDLSGSKSDITLPFRFKLTERLALAGSIPIQYLSLEGAKVYGLGANLALPYRVRIMSKEEPLNWRLTPMVGLSLRASSDLASGAALFQYGLINSIDYRLNERWIFCLVNQLSGYQSLTVSYDDYEFDPDITQLILKNGVRAVTRISPRWILDGYIVDSRFLEEAAVKQFWTFGGSAKFKLTKSRHLLLGFNYDTGDDFTAWSVGLSSAWKF